MTVRKKAFTLIELLVVISIIALLMAILMPSLARARKQAKSVVCLSNLKQWGLILNLYAQDYDNGINPGPSSEQRDEDGRDIRWMQVMRTYYESPDIRVCPEASIPTSERIKGGYQSLEYAWGVFTEASGPQVEEGDYGSYALNWWACNPSSEAVLPGPVKPYYDRYWKKLANMTPADQIPLAADSTWYGVWPLMMDMPPKAYVKAEYGTSYIKNHMRRLCVDRHNMKVNMIFADMQAKPVEMKHLWNQRWHKGYDTKMITDEFFQQTGASWILKK
ncbi:type II secretion system protein G [Limihaloglobus sulfuriphilus]|uniref:Type II secretion system protein G n=1 Tax=Limihaloglobus sulfuriphilus TaxID=1851148 RepID=A0A1Q2MEZ9_9BACT|nr:type II secretion system protein [Limihaloglobus sulfuriphilus]AQQ70867.1 type II secretion system protein G [Limihaloglobus sulfuriphilus]